MNIKLKPEFIRDSELRLHPIVRIPSTTEYWAIAIKLDKGELISRVPMIKSRATTLILENIVEEDEKKYEHILTNYKDILQVAISKRFTSVTFIPAKSIMQSVFDKVPEMLPLNVTNVILVGSTLKEVLTTFMEFMEQDVIVND